MSDGVIIINNSCKRKSASEHTSEDTNFSLNYLIIFLQLKPLEAILSRPKFNWMWALINQKKNLQSQKVLPSVLRE